MYKTATLVRKYAVILLLLLFSSGLTRLQAQTTLATGDISIIGFNSWLTARGGFSFVTWVDLQAGTVIKFTDDGFNNSGSALGSGSLRDREQTLTWTATSAITAGTIINIEGNGSTATYVPTTGTASVKNYDGTTTPYMSLTSLGDQVFAFQGGTYSPSGSVSSTMAPGTVMLYGISFQGNGTATSWFTSGTAGSGDTYQPSELVNNSVYLANNAHGGSYTGPRTGTTIAGYKALINNAANWTTYNQGGITPYNTTAFSITPPPSITVQPSNATVCASSSTTFSITASNASSYQWQVNTGSGFTNVSNGGVYSGATTATLTITGATASMNNYQYNCVATGVSPSATSNSATLTVNSTNTWAGGTSTAWNTAANWSCGIVPTASNDVVIPSGTTFSPTVNITTAICNNLTINSGASLTFTAGSNVLEVKGTFTNNGTFTASAGKLKLTGTSSQTIPAATYKDLELNGAGTKTAGGAISISGVLTLTTGYLQLGTYDLTLGNSSSIVGGTANPCPSYIITNSTGAMKIQNIGTGGKTGAVLFPVGTSSSSYTPVRVTNTGTVDIYSVRVINTVYRSYDASDVPNGPVQNTYNVNKTWMVSETTPGGSNVTLNFQWGSTDEQPGFDDGACFVSHFYGGSWHATNSSGATANGFDPYDMSLTGVTSFSPFAIGSQFSILPLDLLSFTGKSNESNNVLTWVTTNEKEFTGFDVERSADGRSYQRIGNVPARANNSTAQTTYTYTDATAAAGNWYYRLKMIDNNGSSKYSTVVQINSSSARQAVYSLQPNTIKGNDLNLVSTQADQQDVHVRIIDVVGREWHKATIRANAMSAGKVSIATPALPSGMYYLQVRSVKTGTVQLLKFSKE